MRTLALALALDTETWAVSRARVWSWRQSHLPTIYWQWTISGQLGNNKWPFFMVSWEFLLQRLLAKLAGTKSIRWTWAKLASYVYDLHMISTSHCTGIGEWWRRCKIDYWRCRNIQQQQQTTTPSVAMQWWWWSPSNHGDATDVTTQQTGKVQQCGSHPGNTHPCIWIINTRSCLSCQ